MPLVHVYCVALTSGHFKNESTALAYKIQIQTIHEYSALCTIQMNYKPSVEMAFLKLTTTRKTVIQYHNISPEMRILYINVGIMYYILSKKNSVGYSQHSICI